MKINYSQQKKIMHVCLCAVYAGHLSYQESMLAAFHKKLGYKVVVVAATESLDTDGNPVLLSAGLTESDEIGARLYRLAYKWQNSRICRKLRFFEGLAQVLDAEQPDIIFVHGCQFVDIFKIIRFKLKQPQVKIYVDNHADFSNSATNWLSKNILHKIIWRMCAKLAEPYAEKFWGVMPARVEFLKEMYKIAASKIAYLPMGADDELVIAAADDRDNFRRALGSTPDEFLIVTGGKIDLAKTQTLTLMSAVKQLRQKHKHIRLLIFGSVEPALQSSFASLLQDTVVDYVGWISAKDSYKYFAAADLVVFPGRHSVFWEQVVAQGIPLVVKYWSGTDHVDIGGNCRFLYSCDESEITGVLSDYIDAGDKYQKLLQCAQQDARSKFFYSEIAPKSIHH